MEGSQDDHYQDLQGLVPTLIHPHRLHLGITSGAGTTGIITHLGGHALHVLGPTGTAGHIVNLQAQMGANLVCHQSLTDMVQLLYPAADKFDAVWDALEWRWEDGNCRQSLILNNLPYKSSVGFFVKHACMTGDAVGFDTRYHFCVTAFAVLRISN